MRIENAYTTRQTIDGYVDLNYLDKPECLHCDNTLSVKPARARLVYSCPTHGNFELGEIKASAMDVMAREMDESNGNPSIFPVLITAIVFGLILKIKNWISNLRS